jgi:hypothetical protein
MGAPWPRRERASPTAGCAGLESRVSEAALRSRSGPTTGTALFAHAGGDAGSPAGKILILVKSKATADSADPAGAAFVFACEVAGELDGAGLDFVA